jgi:hypothetical protein
MRDAASQSTAKESAESMARSASMRDAARESSEEEPMENMAEITAIHIYS